MSNTKRLGTALAIFFFAALLLCFPMAAAEGARQGLLLCANVVIPTLFPFMALSGFLALSGVGDILAWPLLPVTRYLLRLPDEAAGAILMSFVGGYPAGAKTVATLVEERRLSADHASRMLCYCVNAGPSFLVSAVGSVIYGSPQAGWILLIAQVAASLVVGIVVSWGKPVPKATVRQESMPMSGAFVNAVTSAATAMLSACAFIVFFSVISALVGLLFTNNPASPFYLLITGLLEVTKGCAESIHIGGPVGFGLAAFFVGFGGFSIMGQVAAIMAGTGVRLTPFVATRPLAGLISAAVALPLFYLCQPVITVMGPAAPPVASASEGGIVGAACMIIAAAILLIGRRRVPEAMGA